MTAYCAECQAEESWQHCKKNPGHGNFLSVQNFALSDLPLSYRDESLLEYIKLMADLTVKLRVRVVSVERPPYYILSKPIGYTGLNTSSHIGTGFIVKISPLYGVVHCFCCDSRKSHHTGHSWAVTVRTATHVVFDDSEAEKTTAELFYDKRGHKQNVRCMHGVRVQKSCVEKDISEVLFISHDAVLSRKIEQSLVKLNQLSGKMQKFEASGAPLSVVVSHPHGCPKQISIREVSLKEIDRCVSQKHGGKEKQSAESGEMCVNQDESLMCHSGWGVVCSVKDQGSLEADGTEECDLEVIEIKVKFPDGERSLRNVWLFDYPVKQTKMSLLSEGGIDMDPNLFDLILILPSPSEDKDAIKILDDDTLLSHYIGDFSVAEVLEFKLKTGEPTMT